MAIVVAQQMSALAKKDICFVVQFFDPFLRDGVAASTYDLGRFLRAHGYNVTLMSFHQDSADGRHILRYLTQGSVAEVIESEADRCTVILGGITLKIGLMACLREEIFSCHPPLVSRMVRELSELGDSFVITTEDDLTGLTAKYLARKPGAHFIHSGPCVGFYGDKPFYINLLKKQTVFAVSRSVQRDLSGELALPSLLWPPFIDLGRYVAEGKTGFAPVIGYYSAGPHKGDELFLRLVRRSPEYRFIAVGFDLSFRGRTEYLGNLEFRGNTPDMQAFYGDISLLLVPSLVEEAHPRVILEAAVNGIPVVANDIGGIPEALGNSGILIDMEDSEDAMVEKYCRAVGRLLNDPSEYAGYRDKAWKRAEDYKREIASVSRDNYRKYLNC
jgi:glycosyltransferase involved in cell wall biosynthesis